MKIIKDVADILKAVERYNETDKPFTIKELSYGLCEATLNQIAIDIIENRNKKIK